MITHTDSSTLEQLVAQKPRFLAFLRARLGDADLAQDLLQAAYLRAAEKGGALRDRERAVPWFYQLLRNSLADHGRSAARQPLAEELQAVEESLPAAPPEQSQGKVCGCLGPVLETLDPAKARLLRRVDLEGAAVSEVAAEEEITANNAGVRLHRARAALRDGLRRSCGSCARNGCLDCDCARRRAV